MKRKMIDRVAFLILSILLMKALAGCASPAHEDIVNIDASEKKVSDTDSRIASCKGKDKTNEVCFQQNGLCLYYDPQLVLDVQPFSETIIAIGEGEPYAAAHPDIIHYYLDMEQAHIYIAEIHAYESTADFAAESFRLLHALINNPNGLSGRVPELPLNTYYRTQGHQQLAANLKQVNFANGSGVRFVTVHAIQNFTPVDNEHLVYIFQGFTDDGNYYFKMYVRLLHAQLPDQDSGEVVKKIYSGDLEIAAEYFKKNTDILNSSEDDYSPKLEWIDTFLASFCVEKID